ncbi:MAG: phenylacetic acid degradation operon negative regulatory protein PaaX, partial [Actinobacteria bacterium]|nr:phenylacetic acid degradation operon negative regulatory protein PaaX [Actinomycetota bacterium]
LLVTVFGDSVVPHGGEVWIGSLTRLVEPLGVSERLVRTSLHRLVGEGLLVTRRNGRRSFYSVAPAARHEFWEADRRIYYPRGGDPWDGRWTVVVETSGVAAPSRAALRQQLAWLGFGTLGSPVHVSPLDRVEELRQLLVDLGLSGQVAVFRGDVPATTGLSDGDLARVISADLGALEPAWREFLRTFRPLAEAVADDGPKLDVESAFLARTLLVHAYRRVVLREPELPAELWPANWVGAAAYEVGARCYHALAGAAEGHLATVYEAGGEPLPAFEGSYAGRFALVGAPSP